MVREQPIDDIGIDAHMELTEKLNSSLLFALEIIIFVVIFPTGVEV